MKLFGLLWFFLEFIDDIYKLYVDCKMSIVNILRLRNFGEVVLYSNDIWLGNKYFLL